MTRCYCAAWRRGYADSHGTGLAAVGVLRVLSRLTRTMQDVARKRKTRKPKDEVKYIFGQPYIQAAALPQTLG